MQDLFSRKRWCRLLVWLFDETIIKLIHTFVISLLLFSFDIKYWYFLLLSGKKNTVWDQLEFHQRQREGTDRQNQGQGARTPTSMGGEVQGLYRKLLGIVRQGWKTGRWFWKYQLSVFLILSMISNVGGRRRLSKPNFPLTSDVNL